MPGFGDSGAGGEPEPPLAPGWEIRGQERDSAVGFDSFISAFLLRSLSKCGAEAQRFSGVFVFLSPFPCCPSVWGDAPGPVCVAGRCGGSAGAGSEGMGMDGNGCTGMGMDGEGCAGMGTPLDPSETPQEPLGTPSRGSAEGQARAGPSCVGLGWGSGRAPRAGPIPGAPGGFGALCAGLHPPAGPSQLSTCSVLPKVALGFWF